ncbi:hypothetical protein KSS87_016760 [Heliosperma pusillum]|nr:hypothetical protein KSS87_016760 [Heliosperma pusillum]
MDELTRAIQDNIPWRLMFADDIVVIDETKEGVEKRLELWRHTLETRGFRLSRSKTEYVRCKFSNVRSREVESITFNGEVVQGSDFFRDLGFVIQKDVEVDGDVAHGIKVGWLKWKSATGFSCDNGKFRKKSHAEDDDYPETIFEATLGGTFYTWSFDSWNGSSRRSSPRFDWRDAFRGTNASNEEWDTFSEPDYKEKACNVGLPKDRAVLGLSPKGPLLMKDVKNAFHLSALKWHPDKHQGPTQAAAEEKFKLCVDAYKSLCSALSGT